MNKLLPPLLFLAGVVAAFLIGRHIGGRDAREGTVTVQVDTLYVRDTITVQEPVIVEKKVVRTEYVPVTDTLRIRDTLYLALEREQVRWQDSLSVVWASGIDPQVDSVRHFVSERVITIETERTVKAPYRWGLGVQAGYGIDIQGKISPYIGIGLSYNLLSF